MMLGLALLFATRNESQVQATPGCFSGASAQTLKFFFGTNSFDFTIDSKTAGLTNPVRSYGSFSQAVDEASDARVYGGMHYRNSTHKGGEIGKQVSRYMITHFFH